MMWVFKHNWKPQRPRWILFDCLNEITMLRANAFKARAVKQEMHSVILLTTHWTPISFDLSFIQLRLMWDLTRSNNLAISPFRLLMFIHSTHSLMDFGDFQGSFIIKKRITIWIMNGNPRDIVKALTVTYLLGNNFTPSKTDFFTD